MVAVSYQAVTSARALPSEINTAALFDYRYSEGDLSPIDQLIVNTDSINRIYLQYLLPDSNPLPQELGALVVLGYMSAVESYVRALVRGLINVDEYARRLVEGPSVSFGAALHHSAELLPEALLEDASIAGPDNVVGILKDLVGVKGHLPQDVQSVLAEYRKICEIRHCCVHRFGKLGTKNAIVLGLDAHKAMLEKPLNVSIEHLQGIAEVLRTFAKTINNYVFRSVLERSVINKDHLGRKMYSVEWKWDYRSDRKRFNLYYRLFASVRDAQVSPPSKEVYDSFRKAFAGAKG